MIKRNMKTNGFVFLVIIVMLSMTIECVFAQKKDANKCTYITDKFNDFTKKRTVVTKSETIADVIKKGFGLSVQAVMDATERIYIDVSAINVGGINGLEFTWGATNSDYINSFDQLDFLFVDGEILSLKDEEKSRYQRRDSWTYEVKSYMIVDNPVWLKFKNTPVKKLRISVDGQEIKNLEIDNKFSEAILKVITCMDYLQIPRSTTSLTPENVTKEVPVQNYTTNDKNSNPLGNNGKVSLYKQWKRITELNKDGIPVNHDNNYLIRYNEDGTYKTSIIMPNGNVVELFGNFQLINDGKIIVHVLSAGKTYSTTGKTYSSIIRKLTETELVLESEDYKLFLAVY